MPQSKYSIPVAQIKNDPKFKHFSLKTKPLLEKIYEDQQIVEGLLAQIFSLVPDKSARPTENPNKWSQNEVIMITFWRQSIDRDQSIFCINNLSDRTQQLNLSDINLICINPWHDLLSGQIIEDINAHFILQPYQCAWITNLEF